MKLHADNDYFAFSPAEKLEDFKNSPHLDVIFKIKRADGMPEDAETINMERTFFFHNIDILPKRGDTTTGSFAIARKLIILYISIILQLANTYLEGTLLIIFILCLFITTCTSM